MQNFNNEEKTDVVSVILEDNNLLDAFADTLESLEKEDDVTIINISQTSISFLQKVRCYIWNTLKIVLNQLSLKTQVLAVLAEYHAKDEFKKVQAILTKEK